MTDFDWNLVRSFLAALDTGSLAAASRKLNISQPTLGRHIDALEISLGVLLFERGRAGMLPTKAALKVAEAARDMKSASASLAMAAANTSKAVEGVVRVTASEVVANYFLPSIIAELLVELPQIEIELVPSNEVENLLQRDADIAIRMVRPEQNDLVTRKVNDMAMGIFADRQYLQRNGAFESIEDLKKHVVIGYDRNDLVIKGFARAGFHVDRHFFRFRCDNQITAIEALVAGVGIGFAPVEVAKRYDNLVQILEDFAIPPLPMWLTSHRELRTSAKIRLVNDFLGERLAKIQLG